MTSEDGAAGEPARFEAVDDQYEPHEVEDRVFEYWDAVDAYERTVEHREGGEPFFFVDGPPYTSGSAHMGTTWNKTLKDVYIRYLRMQGYDVADRPGYDMHGLPIETKVEERLGFENKKDIEAYGEENFIEECKAFAEEQLEGLQADFRSFGVWMDWADPYRTVDPEYMEAAWWGFQRAHERGLVERGKRSINQCPRCETAIANNEVEREEVTKPSIYVKFPLREFSGGADGEAVHLVIWTTTPWTIPANTFVAVDGSVTYQGVRAEKDGESEVLYIAQPRVEEVLKTGRYQDYEVVDEVSGEEMVGWTYDHPLAEEVPDHASGEGSLQVYTADYVDAGDQTGLVHSAPGHGEEDFERGRELGLDVFCPVGGDGVFTDAGGAYAGQFVRDANDDVVADLDAKGLLLASESGYTVNEGHCWRCDTGIVRIVTDQWFITITDIKDELLDNIEDSEWHPQWARDNRFRDFVADAPDWNVSRQRYWGIPIPIWTPDGEATASNGDDDGWSGDMDAVILIGDREELAERVDQEIDPGTVDLHKGTVDDLTITEDGTTYTRVPDVFDVWLDSSVATWGTIGFPGERETYEELWPADLIMEAHDQTRGWFWSQLGMGTAATGQSPYEEVLMHGWALAEDGRKMSKSLGNIVAPEEAIERHGADPMRLFLLSQNPQGDDMIFSWEEMQQMERRLNILWNVFRFPLPYMRMDGFDPETTALGSVADDLEVVDRWVLARLHSVVRTATGHFGAGKDDADSVEGCEAFRQDKGLEALLEFVVDDVSRFYVQSIRERMWEETDSASKQAAYATLYRVLEDAAALFAPYAPFVAEEIYQTLSGEAGHDSVHMCDWPTVDERWADPELEDHVHVVRGIEKSGQAARQQAGRNLRWPVQRVVVSALDRRVADAVDARRPLLRERLNAREIHLVGPDEEWEELSYWAEADMSVVGRTFGGDANRVMEAFNESRLGEPTVDALRDALADEEWLDTDEITEEMVESFEEYPLEDVSSMDFNVDAADDDYDEKAGGRVYVDSSLTEDIESEGYAREVIRRVQEMRKDLDLDIEEEIRLDLDVRDERVAGLVAEHEGLVREEVRAAELSDVRDGHRRTWDVEGVEVEIAIEPTRAG
jgi:isoleucyl-tRNA synthetase